MKIIKVKDNLKDAHNYVREFLNQRLKKDKKRTSKEVSKDNIDRPSSIDLNPIDINPIRYESPIIRKRKPIVRHY